ncbi:FAD-dependent monooxygenase [Mesobacillus campisalis]|uniref:FAD-dependent monooxygenase n=1 Tax=Mesobacillus campisalis TaxID=1408103 RepID=UPI0012E18D58|nr:FAD-dependent monooxygenase [Mesobacillus campisalis]
MTDYLRTTIFNDLLQGPAFALGPDGVSMFISVHDPLTIKNLESDPLIKSITVKEDPYIIWSVAASDNAFHSNLKKLNSSRLMDEASRLINGWDQGFGQIVGGSLKDSTSQFHFWFPNSLEPWYNDRITLIGDAIHPMPPTGGLGASTAIIDAVNLAEHLEQEKNPSTAFSKYQSLMLDYAPGFVDEARRPLLWQKRFSNNFIRKLAMSLFLPSVNTLIQVRNRLKKGRF